MIGIGVKEDDNIYLGCTSNSYTFTNAGYCKGNMGLFNYPSSRNTLVIYSGKIKERNVFKYEQDLIVENEMDGGKLDEEYLVTHFIRDMILVFKDRLILEPNKSIDSISNSIIVAKDDDLFEVTPDMLVLRKDDFVIVGDGKNYVRSFYTQLDQSFDPVYKILKSLYAAVDTGYYGGFPIIIRNTKNPSEIRAYGREQATRYIKDYERKAGIR